MCVCVYTLTHMGLGLTVTLTHLPENSVLSTLGNWFVWGDGVNEKLQGGLHSAIKWDAHSTHPLAPP